jgi:hypothetical protein
MFKYRNIGQTIQTVLKHLVGIEGAKVPVFKHAVGIEGVKVPVLKHFVGFIFLRRIRRHHIRQVIKNLLQCVST